MKIDILTLFPESFAPFKESIISRAQKNGVIEINIINIRDFTLDKHKKCDDTPFGGGAGMLMSVQPVYDAVKSVLTDKSKLVYPSPSGRVFNSAISQQLAQNEHLIFICGHYEGIDQRLIELFGADEISIGDYVLTGGEIPTMAIVDSLLRFVPGVLKEGSLEEESFSNGLLEYPQYTRPQIFEGLAVPDVLLSGNHQEIAKFRHAESLKKTQRVRPDLLKGEKFEN
ncbi:MAG TPA: tRNA (guanosine(37)-N1)-methyltransferase TrmD [Clostridiales bacterium]|nr:tRNA (guanosine(37)-N1)-methyltransferase TrmD [Clostridiales bacterium]